MGIFGNIGRGLGKLTRRVGDLGKKIYKRPISIFKGAIAVVKDPKQAAKDIINLAKHPGQTFRKGTRILVNDAKGRAVLARTGATTTVKAGQILGRNLVKVSDVAIILVDNVQMSVGSFLRAHLPGFDAAWAYLNEWTPLGQITSRYSAMQTMQRLIMHGEIPDKRFILSQMSPKIARVYDKLDKIKLVSGDIRRIYREKGDVRGTVLQH